MTAITKKYLKRARRATEASEADRGPSPIRSCQVCSLRYPPGLAPIGPDALAPLHSVRVLTDTPFVHVCLGSGLTQREQSQLVAQAQRVKLALYAQRGKA